MIFTHTVNAEGLRRIYLGAKSSFECWVEPREGGIQWSFHIDAAVCGTPLSDIDKRHCAIDMLLCLARALGVEPAELKDVPFERIAALHTGNPFDARRVAVPRSKSAEHCFMASPPKITCPDADYRAQDFARARPVR